MKYLLTATILLALVPGAHAQTAAPQSVEQRTALQIGQLVLQGNTQAAQIDQLTQAVTKYQARVKELEDKYEPKAEPKPSE